MSLDTHRDQRIPGTKSDPVPAAAAPADKPTEPGKSTQTSGGTLGIGADNKPRASIFSSPLSLLATNPGETEAGNSYTQGGESIRDATASTDSDEPNRSSLPMLVVVIAAIVVTIAGYYTLRWKNQPHQLVSQQEALPSPANGQPASPPPAAPSDSATSSAAPQTTSPDVTVQPQSESPTLSAGGDLSATQSVPSGTSTQVAKPDATLTNPAPLKKTSEAKPRANAAAAASELDATGTEELGQARLLLRGVNGKRDSVRAAQLLWNAVGNGSVAAEVELAALYIAGDGVKKNCEQARVLLRAAASRGSEEAAKQRANLARNGCAR
jgi:hypothetical protein